MVTGSSVAVNKKVLRISMVLYGGSLFTAYHCNQHYCPMGYEALLVGWTGIIVLEVKALIWLANPMLAVAWALYNRPMSAILFSLCAVFIGSFFMGYNDMPILDGEYIIESMQPGYWLWLSSMAVMVMGNSWLYYTANKSPEL